MKNINCIVCGSVQKEILVNQTFEDYYLNLINPNYRSQVRRLVACNECGFVYHDPQLDKSDLNTLYHRFRDLSFRNETPDEYFDRITLLPADQSENSQKIAWLIDRVPERLAVGKKLLDIGCGGGVFIHSFLKAFPSWTACGVEPTPAFAELAGRRLGLPVISGNYVSKKFDIQFDLITINHVLEHVSDPVAFLKDVKNDLNSGGAIYLEVPDVLDFSHLPQDHDRFLMQHLWVFSKISLVNICKLAGYDIAEIDQQTTIRGKRNIVVVLIPSNVNGTPSVKRETVASVRDLCTWGH